MFGKFITNNDCMRVVAWLLSHPDGEYPAAILGVECGIEDMTSFMAVISVLEGVHIINIDEYSEVLKISLAQDESIVQLLTHFKDEFNDQAFRSDQVSPALGYLTSKVVRKLVDTHLFEELEVEKLTDLFENYEELDLDDPLNEEVYKICTKLIEEDKYEEFINNLHEIK